MFTKKKWMGSAHAYKTVIDWGAVFGTIFVVTLGIVLLASV